MAVAQLTVPPLPSQDGVEFASIPGFIGYCASSDGRILSCRRRGGGLPYEDEWHQLGLYRGKYLMVTLWQNGVKTVEGIHRLVLLAFVGPPPELNYQACHNDGNRRNNRHDNLRWDTASENCLDRTRHGTWTPKRKLTPELVNEIRASLESGMTGKETAKKFGVSETAVGVVKRRRSWVDLAATPSL